MVSESRRHPGLNLGSTDTASHEAAEETVFGFWIFMMSDLVLFALLFATYAAMSAQGLAGGPGPRDVVALPSLFAQTMLLLASSFAIGMASLALKYERNRRQLCLWLLATMLLGAGFLALEVHDFLRLAAEEGAVPQRSGFLSAFYLLVGTHGVHVAGGLLWALVMLVQIGRPGLVRMVKLRLMRLCLFWHMLDIVWIAIFTFVFLAGAVQ